MEIRIFLHSGQPLGNFHRLKVTFEYDVILVPYGVRDGCRKGN
jgi:hypothetical protein